MIQHRTRRHPREGATLTLSSRELEQLTDTVRVLVSPLDYESVDEWRSRVNARLKELLRADSAGFLLPVEDGLMLYSEEHDPAELARYQDYPPPPLIDGTPLWEQMLRSRVMTLASGYGRNYDLYLDSPYYQEYAGANGAHDTLAMAKSIGGRDARGMACLHFWHAHPTRRLFGERETSLLRVVYPAFCAGVEAQQRFGEHRAQLLDTFDALGQAVMVCDTHGAVLHRTTALESMLAADPQAEELYAALQRTMHSARTLLCARGGGHSPMGPVVAQAQTEFAAYVVRASLFGVTAGRALPTILVSLERRTPVPLSEEELRAAFGLSQREVCVATLIAQGCSNAQIAERLVISPHTARRHTERVLLKLGVRSRAEVASKLLR